MNNRLALSVVTTTYNNENEIIGFLDNICGQSCIVDEIVVSDGGSSDNTIQLIRNYSQMCDIPIVLNVGKHLNIAQGFNNAIRSAQNDIICIMSTGNHYPMNFIHGLYNDFLERQADVLCPLIRGENSNAYASFYNMVSLNYNMGINGCGAPNHGCIAKKEIFYSLGFFYEGFHYAGEDAEFFWLAKNNGVNIELDSSIYLLWDTPRSLHEHMKQVEVYTIAENQWAPLNHVFVSIKKPVISLILLLLGLVLLPFPHIRIISVLFFLLSLVCPMVWTLRYGVYGSVICIVKNYYKVYCHIRYCKFSKKNSAFIETILQRIDVDY